jgi:hypothetical protein
MTTVTRLVSVGDHEFLNGVIQCPVVLRAMRDHLELLVASRDALNRSRVLRLIVELVGGKWRIEACSIFLEAANVSRECVGVMPGALWSYGDGDGRLFGNAFFMDGHFQSELFSIAVTRCELSSGGVEPHSFRRVFADSRASQTTFRSTPCPVNWGQGLELLYAASRPRPRLATASHMGFPSSYGIFRVSLNGEMQSDGPESLFLRAGKKQEEANA